MAQALLSFKTTFIPPQHAQFNRWVFYFQTSQNQSLTNILIKTLNKPCIRTKRVLYLP